MHTRCPLFPITRYALYLQAKHLQELLISPLVQIDDDDPPPDFQKQNTITPSEDNTETEDEEFTASDYVSNSDDDILKMISHNQTNMKSNKKNVNAKTNNVIKYRGMKNPHTRCYMNSFIQQLYMEPEFREAILNCEGNKSDTIADSLQKHLK